LKLLSVWSGSMVLR